MFDLSNRQKFLRCVKLDGAINRENINYLPPEEKDQFIKAIATFSNLSYKAIRRQIYAKTSGLVLDKNPSVRIILLEAFAHYNIN